MSRRYKSRTMKFGVPLSVPASRYVEHCYGMHGKGFGGCPLESSTIELVLLNAQRQLWRVGGSFPRRHKYLTDATTHDSGWRILGWRMADGSMPLGDYDAVDPELAQFDYLPVPNAPEAQLHSIPSGSGPTLGITQPASWGVGSVPAPVNLSSLDLAAGSGPRPRADSYPIFEGSDYASEKTRSARPSPRRHRL